MQSSSLQEYLKSEPEDLNFKDVPDFVFNIKQELLNEDTQTKCEDMISEAIAEEPLNNASLIKFEEVDIKNEENHDSANCSTQEKPKAYVPSFECGQCGYRTIYKSTFRRHVLRHQSSEEVNIYKCEQCDYKTFRKDTIQKHIRRHRGNPEEAKKLSQCN